MHTMPSIIVDTSEVPDTLHTIRLHIVRGISRLADECNLLVLLLFRDLHVTFPECPSPGSVERLIRPFGEFRILPGLATIDADIDSNNTCP
jgi:hypothetical protein